MPSGDWLMGALRPARPAFSAPDILISAALPRSLLTGIAAGVGSRKRVSRPLSALAYASDEVARGRTAPSCVSDGPDDMRRAAEPSTR